MRWLLNEETDARYRCRTLGMTAQGLCFRCNRSARLHPLVTCGSPICRDCVESFLMESPSCPLWTQICSRDLLPECSSLSPQVHLQKPVVAYLEEMARTCSCELFVVLCEYCHFGKLLWSTGSSFVLLLGRQSPIPPVQCGISPA